MKKAVILQQLSIIYSCCASTMNQRLDYYSSNNLLSFAKDQQQTDVETTNNKINIYRFGRKPLVIVCGAKVTEVQVNEKLQCVHAAGGPRLCLLVLFASKRPRRKTKTHQHTLAPESSTNIEVRIGNLSTIMSPFAHCQTDRSAKRPNDCEQKTNNNERPIEMLTFLGTNVWPSMHLIVAY